MSSRLSDIDLKLLQVFIAVVESGGFGQAQAVLNLSPSRLSTMIAELESRLEMRLCQRGRVGFRLTERGQEVYQAALRLVAGLEAFRAEIGAMRGKLVGNLAIGLVDSIISNPAAKIAAAINAFCQRQHEVHVTLHIDAPQELERKVQDGRLDLGIGAFHHVLPSLRYRALFLEEQTLYCSKAHPLFDCDEAMLTPEELLRHDYGGRGYMEGKRPLKFKAKASSYSMEGLAMLVLSGAFIAYLPSHYAEQWVAKGEMRALLPNRMSYQSLFEVVTRRSATQQAPAQAFLDDLARTHGQVSGGLASNMARPIIASI
ncbi:LysR family transcriptional regulator [Dongia soli]|uniref:LysR family transcriptional regulator n=1 Tax=Dongia soli TaxID=600628 RepID=A0ABU5EHK4_9PROT|nr:LysR family transcriptional regulator [Dongia soli]MDY0884871.1 LysR family transcriptional regulator [Dongia soli]